MSKESPNFIDNNADGIKAVYDFATDKENGFFSIGGIIRDCVAGKLTRIPKSIAGSLKKIYNGVNDRIEIPQDQKTLIGEDFASLYEACDVETMRLTDNSEVKVLTSKSSYSTEMSLDYSYLPSTGTDLQNYVNLSDISKATYEITLMTKKYANSYSATDMDHNDELAHAYAENMSKYQDVCTKLGIDWTQVLSRVSNELQSESCEYTDLSKEHFTYKSFTGGYSWDADRILANRSHGMLVSYAKEACPEYEDKQYFMLEGKVSYDESFDTTGNPSELTFLGKIVVWGKEIASRTATTVTNFFDKHFGSNDDKSVNSSDLVDIQKSDDYDIDC